MLQALWKSDRPAAGALAEQIVETVREPLLVLDATLRVRWANRAFYHTFRVSPEETVDRLLGGLGDRQWDSSPLRELLEQVLPHDRPFEDVRVERAFPTIGLRTMLLNARKLLGAGDDELILLTIEDITERKALEQVQRDFIVLVGHEMRNPLAAIVAYAQLMQRRGAYDEKALATIVTQARQLDRLVGDLLDSGRLQLQPTETDLVALARIATREAQLTSPLHRVCLESPDGPLQDRWDRGRLAQVFANLLGNAIKYSPAGGEVLVRIEDLGTAVRVSVEDQGVGITPAALPHLFDRYYRAPATAGEVQGLGLGLHVTRALVEAHGGSVQVESLLGRGSVFTFTLPRSEALR